MGAYVVCPYCGAINFARTEYCERCGRRLDNAPEITTNTIYKQPMVAPTSVVYSPRGLPLGVQESLSPAVLFYNFKEEFEDELNMGGVWGMVAATIYSMLSNGVISIYLSKRGRVFKKDTLLITKQRMFDPQTYGFLSLKISGLPYGYSINVYDLVFDSSKKNKLNDPESYITDSILHHDLNEATWNFLFREEVRKTKLSLLDKLLRVPDTYYTRYLNITNANYYRPQVEKLKNLLRYYVSYRPWETKVIRDECNRALSDMRYYETDY